MAAYSGAYGANNRPDTPLPAQAGMPPKADAPVRPPERKGMLDLGGILKKIEAAGMETDDLLMALILFLMYRESGDIDLLIMLGVMLLT